MKLPSKGSHLPLTQYLLSLGDHHDLAPAHTPAQRTLFQLFGRASMFTALDSCNNCSPSLPSSLFTLILSTD